VSDFTGVSHVGLSVTDLDRSVAWYTDVLGLKMLAPTDAPGMRRVLLVHPGSGLLVGLAQHERGTGATFDETVSGLDHLAFNVSDRDGLVAWEERLKEKGVTYSPIQDTAYGSVLNFRDPDSIQLELFTMPAQA
jgi:catechol 2,3-dioxygenase-like lactoylglutathione lyase family enzyme